jgi:hypothetical protein
MYTCIICGNAFIAARISKFCKKKCANAAWYIKNKEKRLLKNKSYRKDLALKAAAYNKTKIWVKNNPDKIKEYSFKNKKKNLLRKKERYKNDVIFKLRELIRSRLNHAIKNNQKIGSSITNLGCSIDELKTYLESKFQPGMTWDNYGRNGWHIDHIKPLSKFNLSDPKEFKMACHYSNLQPLWAKDNLRKGSKYE